jgi:DnaJ-class molecular chaperone
MIPISQTCPQCSGQFIGSDIIGHPCPSCQGLDSSAITAALLAMNQMYNQEEQQND